MLRARAKGETMCPQHCVKKRNTFIFTFLIKGRFGKPRLTDTPFLFTQRFHTQKYTPPVIMFLSFLQPWLLLSLIRTKVSFPLKQLCFSSFDWLIFVCLSRSSVYAWDVHPSTLFLATWPVFGCCPKRTLRWHKSSYIVTSS